MIIDHTEDWELPENTKQKYFNELQSLRNLWKGLCLLYNQMKAIEGKAAEQIQNGSVLETMPEDVKNEFKGKQIKYFSAGNGPLFNWIDKGILYSLFQWYAVSACNYVELVGWLCRQERLQSKNPRQYVCGVIPNVLWFRDKIAAHFVRARQDNQDTNGDRVASVLYQVGYDNGRFCAPVWKLSLRRKGMKSASSNEEPWSITETHEALMQRYNHRVEENQMAELGKLVKVELREAWKDEAHEFTPWLAQEENIKLLGDTIGIELEVEAQEKPVGPFSADILCKDTVNNHWVLIENQLERTDHTHLGQLMTYAAGLDAVTIIWIAKKFTDEHRAAMDWLNEITDESINFFGLEVELWQIGESPTAPKFNIISKPNEWSKKFKTTTVQGELSETKKLQLEYWTRFREFMEESESFVRCQKPAPQHWTCFSIGRAYFHLVARVNTKGNEIGVYLCICGPEKQPHFNLLNENYRKQIDSEIGMKLNWRELPDAKESQIAASSLKADPKDKNRWPEQHEWIKNTVETFHKVLSPIVKELDVSDYQEAVDSEDNGDDE